MTRYLLDTHVVYRWMQDDRRLRGEMRRILTHGDCTVSVISLWEMLIKHARGKLSLPKGSLNDTLQARGFSVLSTTARHVEETRRFDQAIPDPFDRLLVATAATEGMLLLTQDAGILDLAERTTLPVAKIAA